MKKKEIKKEILTIAFPSKGITNPAFACALRLLNLDPFRIYETIYISGCDTAVSRNKLANAAKGDYILFLDDDVLPPPNTIGKLYAHKKDFVSGLYFARQRPHYPQIHTISKEDERRCDSVIDYKRDALIEVDATGGGCMLIKKKVFEKLEEPYFHYIPAEGDAPKMGEDFYFCKKVKKAGFKIYCDTSVVCKHIGETFIGPEHWDFHRAKLTEIEKMMGPKGFEKYKQQVRKLDDRRRNIVNR